MERAMRLGLIRSPKIANAETNKPPRTMRRRISLSIETRSLTHFKSLHSLLDAPMCCTGSLHIKNSIFFAGQVVVVDEELLQFLYKLFAEIINVSNIGPRVIRDLYRHQSIIAFCLFPLSLLTFEHSN